MSYSFLNTGLWSPYVGLFLVILFFFVAKFLLVNWSVSLISLSDFSSLVYRNARDFCALILCPATLPNALNSSTSFLVASLGFLCIVPCHLQRVTVLLLLF